MLGKGGTLAGQRRLLPKRGQERSRQTLRARSFGQAPSPRPGPRAHPSPRLPAPHRPGPPAPRHPSRGVPRASPPAAPAPRRPPGQRRSAQPGRAVRDPATGQRRSPAPGRSRRVPAQPRGAGDTCRGRPGLRGASGLLAQPAQPSRGGRELPGTELGAGSAPAAGRARRAVFKREGRGCASALLTRL